MKKLLCKLTSKLANTYGTMVSNASAWILLGQTKAPACLVKKD